MKSLCIALLTLACVATASAQRLTISELDTSKFPVIGARIYPLDRDGILLDGLDESDFRVIENGSKRRILSLKCTPPSREQPLSTVLTIDVSGSMSSAGARAGTPNMDLARAAASSWIDEMPDGSETALTIFDHGSLIVQDFTDDRDLLRASILALSPNGGTNYDAGLVKAPSGALAIADKGKHKRVVIFLTDGRGRGDEREIVAHAARIGATIFCVTLGMPAPEVLKNIARRTGGECYENVSTLEDARAVYRTILFRAMGGEPCEITWNSESACTVGRELSIEIPSLSLAAVDNYSAPASSIARLDVEPPAVTFGTVRPGETLERSVTLTAINRDVNVSRIAAVGLASNFTIDIGSDPFVLRAGERRVLKVRYRATDSNYHFARWRIENDACVGGAIFASVGIGNPPEPSINVVHPNGGERFHAGDITEIVWDGVRPSDTVHIDYSTDAGRSWLPVVARAGGLAYQWRVPATPSNRCLARVGLVPPGPSKRSDAQMFAGPTDYVITSAFSPDGRRVAAGSWDGTASVWDAASGRRIQRVVSSSPGSMGARAQRVYYVEFNPDGSRLLTADEANAVKIWDVASGRLIRTFEGSVYNKPDTRGRSEEGEVTPERVFSADGRRIILKVDNTPTLFDVENGRQLLEITGHNEYINEAVLSPDGSMLATSSIDSTVALWRVANGALVRRFKLEDEAEAVTWSPDGSMIATTSFEDRGMIRIWNTRDFTEVVSIPTGNRRGSGRGLPRVLFHPDGERVLVWAGSTMNPKLVDLTARDIAEYDQNGTGSVGYATFSADGRYVSTSNGYNIKVYDTERGTMLNEIGIDAQASYVAFSPDATRVAGALGDTLGVWQANRMAAQSDVSDSLWTIVVESKPVAIDVDFGSQAVRVAVDSVVSAFIRNDGTHGMRVNDIRFAGLHPREFSLVSGIPPFDVGPGESRQVEFEFTPARVGERRAIVVIDAGGTTLERTIRGDGVEPQLRLELTEVDFDSVDVGDSRDSLVSVALRNTGEIAVDVRRTVIAGPDSTQFEVVDGGGPFVIAPGSSHAMKLRFAPNERGRTSTILRFEHSGIGNANEAYLYGEGVGHDLTDPTTFLSIITPNAIIPPRGRFVAASYDVVGLLFGYVPIDNVMVMAGGAVPLPDDWGGVIDNMYGAFGVGIKAGIEVAEHMNIAGGLTWGRSIYDAESTVDTVESTISALTPFIAASYGDDDSRISATIGRAMKTHKIILAGEIEKDAMIVSVGGDYRFDNRWKLAAEVISMESLGYIPIAVTARYFGKTWALDVGLV
ncbi:MAG: choice-of-anchor D domain-containing protein, partial [bacterium]|nr:choice-of-anchor D domain-containing protein [Candidatus Kapabacteria bacterium]